MVNVKGFFTTTTIDTGAPVTLQHLAAQLQPLSVRDTLSLPPNALPFSVLLESRFLFCGQFNDNLEDTRQKRTVAHGPFVQRKPNFVSIGAVSAGIVRKLRS